MSENIQVEDKPSTDIQAQHIKGAIEALLFVNERPITVDQIKKIIKTISVPEIRKFIKELTKEYNARQSGFSILEIADGFQMLTDSRYATYVKAFYKSKHKEKLSKPALETLAIFAYKQPTTRADIEQIRGVNSDGVVAHLLEKELIKVVGRKEVPGRPFLYGTTKQFLEYFGLKSLDVLPNLEELEILQTTEVGTGEDGGVARNTMEAAKQAAISGTDDEHQIAHQEIPDKPVEEISEENALEEADEMGELEQSEHEPLENIKNES